MQVVFTAGHVPIITRPPWAALIEVIDDRRSEAKETRRALNLDVRAAIVALQLAVYNNIVGVNQILHMWRHFQNEFVQVFHLRIHFCNYGVRLGILLDIRDT